MYSQIITWFKTYSDTYLKDYYDNHGNPIWFLRTETDCTLLTPDSPDYKPCGVTQEIYYFAFQFYVAKEKDTAVLEEAFLDLVDALLDLWTLDNTITLTDHASATRYIKIDKITHTAAENEGVFGYQLNLDIKHLRI